jgi:protein-disulfide isomerase
MRPVSRFLLPAIFMLASGASPDSSGQSTDLKPEQCLGGSLDAPIRVEVFSDFECPACRQLYLETMRPVLKDYCSLDKVCVIYHEFPLQGHKYSRQAARYAKAAQRLGRKQWGAVVDALFENQEKWSLNGAVDDVVFKALGEEEYFNLKKLLQDPEIDRDIDAEVSLGYDRKVESTPTYFIWAIGREQRVTGFLAYPVLKAYFDRIVR